MGAGVAGLRAAVELARHGEVLVVTKEAVAESNTHYAQGGIAVAMEGDADVALHLKDTVNAGDGLVYRPAAEALVAEGPVRVAELIEWGAAFDEEGGELLRTREGAHSRPRILHANGDATGAEISRSLAAFARVHKRIRFAEWTTITGLLVAGGRVIGADLLGCDRRPERIHERVSARAVLVAAGGGGQVYSDTTNPAVATGDGIALAAEAGAELADMEFYQFHPTALSLAGAPRFLLSEALSGEGAILLNDRGERFMERYHPLLELAPRDVVARAITREGMGAAPGEARRCASGHAARERDRPAPALSRHQRVSGAVWPRPGPRSDSRSPGCALPDGRHQDRPLRPQQLAGALRRGRGSLHRRPRRQPAGLELAARGTRLRRARGPVHAGRQLAAGEGFRCVFAGFRNHDRKREDPVGRGDRQAASGHVGLCRACCARNPR